MLQLLVLLQARFVWSFFTKSTQCLKLCDDSMIWLVQLSYQYQKNLPNYTVLIQTLNRLFFPFATCCTYILHVHHVWYVIRNRKWLSCSLHCSIIDCQFSNLLLSKIMKFLFTKPSWVFPVQQQASCDFDLQQFQQAQHHLWHIS